MPAGRKTLGRLIQRFRRSLATCGTASTVAQDIPCHLNSLFVGHDGTVLPCCNYSGRPIGLLSDFKTADLWGYQPASCCCKSGMLGHLGYEGPIAIRAASNDDEVRIGTLHVVSTLKCQARCAHCIEARERDTWRENPSLAKNVLKLVDEIHPSLKRFFIQGGEIGIDCNSVHLLKKIKERYPQVTTRVISNGCLDDVDVGWFTACVDEAYFSLVGFSEACYRITNNLNFNRTLGFIEQVLASHKVKVVLKYLITPINIHETPEFLKWCFRVDSDANILISAVESFEKYIAKIHPSSNFSEGRSAVRWKFRLRPVQACFGEFSYERQDDQKYDYWKTIIERAAAAINEVVDSRSSHGKRVVFDERARMLLGL